MPLTSSPANAVSATDWHNKGSNYLGNGQYDNAINAFNEAIKINPTYVEAYNNRGLSYFYKGMYDNAIGDFDKALNIKPNHISSYNNRALAYNKKGMYDKALDDLNKALELNKNFYPTYANRAEVYVYKGMYDQAIEDCNKGISLSSTVADFYNTRGNAYRLKGMYEQALKDYDKALSLDPKLKEAYTGREATYRAINKTPVDFNKTNIITPLTKNDLRLDGFAVGDLVDSLIIKYGQPSEIKEYNFNRARFVMYKYNGLLEVHFLNNNRRIWSIVAYSPDIFTPRNIAVGYSVDDIVNLYGNKCEIINSPQGNILYRYFVDRNIYPTTVELAFEVDKSTGKILRISVDDWAN